MSDIIIKTESIYDSEGIANILYDSIDIEYDLPDILNELYYMLSKSKRKIMLKTLKSFVEESE